MFGDQDSDTSFEKSSIPGTWLLLALVSWPAVGVDRLSYEVPSPTSAVARHSESIPGLFRIDISFGLLTLGCHCRGPRHME